MFERSVLRDFMVFLIPFVYYLRRGGVHASVLTVGFGHALRRRDAAGGRLYMRGLLVRGSGTPYGIETMWAASVQLFVLARLRRRDDGGGGCTTGGATGDFGAHSR